MLITDGITIEKANCTPSQYIININRYLTDRINNCKSTLPTLAEVGLCSSLFLMPKWTLRDGDQAGRE